MPAQASNFSGQSLSCMDAAQGCKICAMNASSALNGSAGCVQAITAKDGQALAHNILAFSEDKTCPDPAGFTSELKSLFDSLDLDMIKARAAPAWHTLFRVLEVKG